MRILKPKPPRLYQHHQCCIIVSSRVRGRPFDVCSIRITDTIGCCFGNAVAKFNFSLLQIDSVIIRFLDSMHGTKSLKFSRYSCVGNANRASMTWRVETMPASLYYAVDTVPPNMKIPQQSFFFFYTSSVARYGLRERPKTDFCIFCGQGEANERIEWHR